MTSLLEQMFKWSSQCDHRKHSIEVVKIVPGEKPGIMLAHLKCHGCGAMVEHRIVEPDFVESKDLNVVNKKENV